ERRGPADVVLEQLVELALELGVAAHLVIGARELVERGHQRLRDVAATVGAEATGRVLSGGHGAAGLADSGCRAHGAVRPLGTSARRVRVRVEVEVAARPLESEPRLGAEEGRV